MNDSNPAEDSQPLYARNYCLSFIDLLGQREAMRNQTVLPVIDSEEKREEFSRVIRNSVGAISKLQERASAMIATATEPRTDSTFRAELPEEQREVWDRMLHASISTQRWSDGFVTFASLGDEAVKCPMNAIFSIIGHAGSLALLGLGSEQPVRGAIEISWGAELHPGEIYGPVVARAYELESEVAGYPRIVVGRHAYHYIKLHSESSGKDHFSQYNRSLAELCLRLLAVDSDGLLMVNFLGEEFQHSVTRQQHWSLYELAARFVNAQLDAHRVSGNSKLAFRYHHLVQYFEQYAPSDVEGSDELHDLYARSHVIVGGA